MERTASRRTAFTLTAGVGLAASIITLIWMAVDQATANSVRTHVIAMYGPYGTIPDPAVPWLFLYATFGAGAICWALTLWGSVRHARWTRLFSTAVFLVGGALLLFLYMASEHDTAILPTGWRIVCLCTAIYGAIVMLVAWLPTTGHIRA